MGDVVVLADRYQLEDVIGRGGMADVYRATDRLLSRRVAVKMLRDTAEDESDRLRFTAEARTLAALNHPGLVMVLDAGITAEQPFLVMELVEGLTLSQASAGKALDEDRVRSVGVQLADALAYAHAKGIVHRDIKPGNVLLGAGDRLKLADFGIARLIGDSVRHTRTGQAIGTAAYLAPEQVRGNEITTAADLYSLGLLLLETLTGERAYPGAPVEAALARLSRPPHIPETLPESWRSLLAKMTASEPADRPTAADVADELRAPSVPTDEPTRRLPAEMMTRSTTSATPDDEAATLIDRAGESLARQPRALVTRFQALASHEKGVLAAIAALVLLIVVAGLAAGGDPGGDDPGGDVPSRTPEELKQPLQDLHDAIEGGSS